MNPRGRRTRQALAAWLSALTLALSVAVPILERADLDHQEHWESEHAVGVCAPAHDHTICTQFGANLSLPARALVDTPVLQTLRSAPANGLAFAFRRARADGPPTRAPPSA